MTSSIANRSDSRQEKILVVDDEAAIRRMLTLRLSMVGYQVVTAADGEAALDLFDREMPDLVVLDIMMPKLDGFGVCRQLREISEVPIVMLSALGDISNRIAGLDLGADDYLAKPFSPKELEARIGSILRRYKDTHASDGFGSGIIQTGSVQINTNKRQVYKHGERIWLTYTEFCLLELLFKNGGEPVPRADLLQQLWGYAPKRPADLRVVDVYIARLRSKLEDDPRNPELIITIRGTGYASQRIMEHSASV